MKMPPPNSLKSIGAAAFLTLSAGIGAPYTLDKEGMRLKPYYDSVGIKTVCGGETEFVEDKTYTENECKSLYGVRYGWFSQQTMGMYTEVGSAWVTPQIHAAMVDMSYNVGVPTVRKSGMMKLLNKGMPAAACAKILEYKFAGGFDCSVPGNKVCYGVWDRRLKTHALCMKGVQP